MTRKAANKLRKELGLSIYEVSSALQIKGWKIQDYESGYRLLLRDDMEKLIHYLEMKLTERTTHEEPPRTTLARGLSASGRT